MAELFLQTVNMSISAGWLVLAVLVLRPLLKKAPKWIAVFLWGIVAVRLICPFSIESPVSLIPSAETVSPEIMTDTMPQIDTGIPVINDTLNPIIGESAPSTPANSVNPLQILIPVAGCVWLLGAAAFLIHTVISYLRLRKKISTAVLLRENIFQSETVGSPFVLGIFRPRIYLPFSIGQTEMPYVIAHEQAHIHRGDHIWKPLGFLLLSFHWFNPLIWLGYVLLCRDIELACDEKVVKALETEQKADYVQALLDCSVNRRILGACPLAFGEIGVKDRIKLVLRYKKPAAWVVLAALLASAAVAVCFLTDPIALNQENLLLGVLDGQKAFVDESGAVLYLRDYKLGGGANVVTVPDKYTLVDMNGDGRDELVVYASPEYGAYLVFHVYRGKIYGFEFAEREMTQLKADGTFVASEGAGISRYCTLRFNREKCTLVEQAYKQDALQNYNNNIYRINGKMVSSDAMYEYTKAFAQRNAAVWTAWEKDSGEDAMKLYKKFLEGRVLAYQGKYLGSPIYNYIGTNDPADGSFSYTFVDMTRDGVPELCINTYVPNRNLHFFTVKSGRLHHWYSWTRKDVSFFLNNGAFLDQTGSLDDGYLICDYYELDANADINFRITYSWWHQTADGITQSSKDDYAVNGKKVSKEEYDRVVEQYGDIGYGDVLWQYYTRPYQEPTLG